MQNETNATQANEIDLLRLCRTLWAGKWLIASCMALALLLAGVYVFFVAQPRYAISIRLNTPLTSSLDQLNRGRERANAILLQRSPGDDSRKRETASLQIYTPQKAFEFFVQSLTSDSTFQQFVRQILRTPDGTTISSSSLERNAWRVRLSAPSSDEHNLYKITVLAESSERARQHLVLFLGIAQAQALETLLDNAANDVATLIDSIENTLAAQRAIAAKQREDRIIRLREALAIAKAVDQDTPQVNLARPSSNESLSDYLEGRELYARGVRALKAELEVLESRENDDAFIDDLRENEARLELLRAIAPDADSLLLYRIDGSVLIPETPVQPRKALFLALALVLGALVGVLWVMARAMVRAARQPD